MAVNKRTTASPMSIDSSRSSMSGGSGTTIRSTTTSTATGASRWLALNVFSIVDMTLPPSPSVGTRAPRLMCSCRRRRGRVRSSPVGVGRLEITLDPPDAPLHLDAAFVLPHLIANLPLRHLERLHEAVALERIVAD